MSLDSSHLAETTLPFFNQLQAKWDEIGEGDDARNDVLHQLEQECVEIYRRKVETIEKDKADLQEYFVKTKAEITQLATALGEEPQCEKMKAGNLRQQKTVMALRLENLTLEMKERSREILDIKEKIARICAEMTGNDQIFELIETDDLTAKCLGGLKIRLELFEYEKDKRLHQVESKVKAIRTLSNLMSLDFDKIMAEIHPSLLDSASNQTKSISNDTLALLDSELESLEKEKDRQLASGEILAYRNVSVKEEEVEEGEVGDVEEQEDQEEEEEEEEEEEVGDVEEQEDQEEEELEEEEEQEEEEEEEEEEEVEEEQDANATCTCTRQSFCRTRRCECKSSGRECGTKCGCDPNMCANY